MIPKETTKLTLIRGKLKGKKAIFDEKDSDAVFHVPFNPGEYSINKGNSFSETAIPGLGSPIIQFTSGNTRTLSLDLLLDTYAYDNGVDVREKYIKKLDKLIAIDGDIHAPPPCKVVWGGLTFVGVVDDMQKNYILFRNDGTPVRARVSLSLKEYVPVEIQVKETPTSSPDRLKKHIVKDGDRLWQLAYLHYGEPDYWRIIADANKHLIDDPKELESGKELVIPPLPDVSTDNLGLVARLNKE